MFGGNAKYNAYKRNAILTLQLISSRDEKLTSTSSLMETSLNKFLTRTCFIGIIPVLMQKPPFSYNFSST